MRKPAFVLGVLALLLASPAFGQEIARIPITRPSTVIVERTPEGGVRVILEFTPIKPKDPADPGGGGGNGGGDGAEGAMARRVDDLLVAIPSDFQRRVLDQLIADLDFTLAAAEASPPRITNVDDAVRTVLSRSVLGLVDVGATFAGPLSEAVSGLYLPEASVPVAGRLRTLRQLLEDRRGP